MIRIDRILCPVDFSEHSRHALDHAIAMARWFGAAVSVMHVHRLATPTFAVGPVVAPEAFLPLAMTTEEREIAQAALGEFVKGDRASGVPIDVLVGEDLNVADAIARTAEDVSAGLIALGTHGRSGVNRWVLGSVAEKVLRISPVPVLTVPPRTPDAVPFGSPAARIVCPIDFSSTSTHALRYAASLAERGQSRLTVVHVVELLPEIGDLGVPDFEAYRKARFEAAGRAMTRTLAGASLETRVDSLMLAGRPYREIVRLASEQQASLIVMGVHGESVMHRMFFGSTAHQVVRQAACPVLTVRGA